MAESAFEQAQVSSSRKLLDCALGNDPRVRLARIALARDGASIDVAGLRPNPELETTVMGGSALGDRLVDAEVALLHTWEIGGKRAARIERAEAEREGSLAELIAAREAVYAETRHSLARIAQLAREKAILGETFETYQRLLALFRKRGRLTPEQEVTAGVFSLAETDTSLQLGSLAREEAELVRRLSLSCGARVLLPLALDLPAPPDRPPGGVRNSERLRASSGIRAASAAREIAVADSWPTFRVGPVFQHAVEGATSRQTLGVALSLPLPIFHANGPARAAAEKEETLAAASSELLLKTQESEKAGLQYRCQSLGDDSKRALGRAEAERKHESVERLFERGLVSASLLIEAHRQWLELERTRSETELAWIDCESSLEILGGLDIEEGGVE